MSAHVVESVLAPGRCGNSRSSRVRPGYNLEATHAASDIDEAVETVGARADFVLTGLGAGARGDGVRPFRSRSDSAPMPPRRSAAKLKKAVQPTRRRTECPGTTIWRRTSTTILLGVRMCQIRAHPPPALHHAP